MRVVIKYTREDRVKYISHLDLMRVMQRALRRADIPTAYSHGFNPHPIIAFASPLPVGVTSESEYMDIVLSRRMSLPVLKEKLNHTLPKGINVLEAGVIDENAPSLMSMIERADYKVTVRGADWSKVLAAYSEIPEIMVEKKTKKGIASVNMKECIYSLSIDKDNQDQLLLSMRIGEKGSLSPNSAVEALLRLSGQHYTEENDIIAYIHRTGLYGCRNGQWITPLSMKLD